MQRPCEIPPGRRKQKQLCRCQLDRPGREAKPNQDVGGAKKCPRNRFEMGQIMIFWAAKAAWRRTGSLAWEPRQKDRERRQMGVFWFAAERQNGNFGYNPFCLTEEPPRKSCRAHLDMSHHPI